MPELSNINVAFLMRVLFPDETGEITHVYQTADIFMKYKQYTACELSGVGPQL